MAGPGDAEQVPRYDGGEWQGRETRNKFRVTMEVAQSPKGSVSTHLLRVTRRPNHRWVRRIIVNQKLDISESATEPFRVPKERGP